MRIPRYVAVLLFFGAVLAGFFEAAPAYAAANPYATRIAFIRGGNVWIVAPDGSHAKQLTKGKADDECPAWSSNHRSVFFVRHSGSTWKLAAVSAKTKKVTYVSYRDPDTGKSRKRRMSAVAVRPSGGKLYFADWREGSAGDTLRIVAINTRTHKAGRKFRNTDYEQIIDSMSLSPGGSRLAVVIAGGDIGTYYLFDTSTWKKTKPMAQSIVGAFWARSGSRLVFSTYNEFPDHVFLAASDGSAALDIPGASGTALAFSPDGKHVLLYLESSESIYTIGTDGSALDFLATGVDADW